MINIDQYKEERTEFIKSIENFQIPEVELNNLFSELSVNPKHPLPQWLNTDLIAANYPAIKTLLECKEGIFKFRQIVSKKFNECGFIITDFDVKIDNLKVVSSNYQEKINIIFLIKEKS